MYVSPSRPFIFGIKFHWGIDEMATLKKRWILELGFGKYWRVISNLPLY